MTKLDEDMALVRAVAYWTEDQARTAVAAWRASGLSAGAFAASHGLCAPRLRRWRRRLDEGPAPAVALLPVALLSTASVAPCLEVDVAGYRIRVPPGFDEATLRRLVGVLEFRDPC